MSHFTDKGTASKNYPESGLRYSRTFTCGFPECSEVPFGYVISTPASLLFRDTYHNVDVISKGPLNISIILTGSS